MEHKSDTTELQRTSGQEFVDIKDVTLLDGIFKESQQAGERYILSLDADRLIAPCCEAAELTPKKPRYEGWEAKSISGHSLGHWMSAMAAMYRATDNSEIEKRLNYTIDELYEIQKQYGNGYIGGTPEQPFIDAFNGTLEVSGFDLNGGWVPWYSIHKIYQGLIDVHQVLGITKALEIAVKFTEWAKAGTDKLTDAQMQKMLECEHGGMNDVFAQMYGLTGNEDYLKLAVRFNHNAVLEPLMAEKDKLQGMHANTQIPKVIGMAQIYKQNRRYEEYLTGASFFWDTVVRNRSYAFGGNSLSEHFEVLGAETLDIKSAETCNTFNMMKLTELLFENKQSAEYMDYMENALVNHILGTQDPCNGNKTYFTSTLPGHYRIYGTREESFWCCTGSGMENPGRYAKNIYYKDGDTLYVNLFIASEIQWREKGLTLRQNTNFPYGDSVKLNIVRGNAKAEIKIRIPSWCGEKMTVAVNGCRIEPQAENGYMSIFREWNGGDIIEFSVPMKLSIYRARDDADKIVFTYGSVILAGALGKEGLPQDIVVSERNPDSTTTDVPYLRLAGESVEQILRLEDEKTLTFVMGADFTSTGKSITLKPFFGIHHEFYNIYWFVNRENDIAGKILNDITIDCVQPDGKQDEIGHNMRAKNSRRGTCVQNGMMSYWWDACGSEDSFFSYDMSVNGKEYNVLYVRYRNQKEYCGFIRDFRISADGYVLAIGKECGAEGAEVFYNIPKSVTAGKARITVTFSVNMQNACVGGVQEVRIVKQSMAKK